MRAEQPPASLFEFSVVYPEAATHGTCILGVHVGIDEVREIRNAVFCGRLPEWFKRLLVPIEILRDVVGWYREREYAPGGIAPAQDLEKSAVEHVELALEFTVALLLHSAAADDGHASHVLWHDDVESDVRKGRLKADARRDVQVEDELLERLLHLLKGEIVVPDERREERV